MTGNSLIEGLGFAIPWPVNLSLPGLAHRPRGLSSLLCILLERPFIFQPL